jgi:DtxR family Mn-dependent transcriptional regulator
MFDGLELSPKKVEYLKYIFEKGENVRTTDLAAHLHVDPSTVSKGISEMTGGGLLVHMPYHGVSLTEFGRKYADFVVRRHRILGLILSHYGLSEDEACREAARFECYVSRDAVNKMCRALGHPSMGICGRISHDEFCMKRPE